MKIRKIIIRKYQYDDTYLYKNWIRFNPVPIPIWLYKYIIFT